MTDVSVIHMQDFDGRTAVVTGAAGGIGLGLVRRFVDEGMSVVMADRDALELDAAAACLALEGAPVLPVATDVTDPGAVDRLAEAAEDRFGPVDVVCANAGVAGPWDGTAWTLPTDEWRRVFDVNVFGVVATLAAFVPRMLAAGRPGHVVVTASVASFQAGATAAPYLASKHAALSVAESLRLQLAEAAAPVGVSVLCPDRVRSRILQREMARAGVPAPDAEAAAEAAFDPADPAVLQPADAAAVVVDGIRSGRFHLFTHGDTAGRVADRYRSVIAEIVGP